MKVLNEKVYNKVELRHTAIVIHNYDAGDDEGLEHLFSVYDKVTHQFYPKGVYYDEKNKDLYLPSGVDLFHIFRSFGEDVFHKVHPDRYDKVKPIKLKKLPRDEVQQEAIEFCVGGGKYTNNKRCSQLFVNLNTGKGKTYVAITVTAIFGVRSMMIASSLDLIKQWKANILEDTDTTPDEIYILTGSSSIAKLFNGMRNIDSIKYVLASHGTLRAYAAKYGWEALHDLFVKLKCGIKIYDEAHLNMDAIFMLDFFTDVWKTFYLTATPARSDYNENKIYQISYKNIPKINLFKETDPHTAYIAILFNSHPNAVELNDSQNMYGFNQIYYANYLVHKPAFYRLLWVLMDIIINTTSPQGKALVYIGTNHAILAVANWIKYYYPMVSVGLFSSLVPKECKRNELNNKIILSTTKSAGAAMDIENLELTVVLDEPFKSPVLTRQTLGRTRGNNTRYIDIVDAGFPSLKYYYNSKKKIFKKYATSCTEVQLNDHQISEAIATIIQKDKMYIQQVQSRSNLKQVVEFIKDKGDRA